MACLRTTAHYNLAAVVMAILPGWLCVCARVAAQDRGQRQGQDQSQGQGQGQATKAAATKTAFDWPCDRYQVGLRGRGNFGRLIPTRSRSVFAGTWHLAEDVWLPGGTEVRAVADGVVRYSDFSPTWIDAKQRKHWNLGNVIVIEHELTPAEDGLTHVCSFYVHLAKDRKVKVGDKVERGQPIGAIGADQSEENGRYPAHLHFGIHRGRYYQLSPAFKRQTLAEATTIGLPTTNQKTGGMELVRGEITEVRQTDDTTVEFRFESGKVSRLSLEIGSTSPGYQPKDIMNWCQGYGDKSTVAEWLRPSDWVKAHPPPRRPRKR